MSNDLVVQLGAKLDQFASDMNQAGDIADSAVSRIEQSFANLNPGIGLGSLGTLAAGATASLGVLLTALQGVNSELAKIGQLAQYLNVSTDQVQKLQFAGTTQGISSDDALSNLQNVGKLLNDANVNENSLTKLLDANNLKYKDQEGNLISINQLLAIGSDLVKNAGSNADKTVIAQMLGLTQQWVPVLEQGAQGFNKIAESATEAGAIIESQTIAKAQNFDAAWKKSSAQLAAQFKAATADVAGYLDDMISKIQTFLDDLNKANGTQTGSGQSKFNAIADALEVVSKDANGAAQDLDQVNRVLAKYQASTGPGSGDPEIIAKLQEIQKAAQDAAAQLQATNQQIQQAQFPNGVPTPAARPAAANEGPDHPTTIPSRDTAKDAYDRATESVEKYTARVQAEADAQGLGAQALEEFKAQAQLTTAAQQAGLPVTQKMTDQMQDLAQDAGDAAAALAKAKVDTTISRGQQTALLSPEDVQIANQLKDLYPNVAEALGSVEASALRTNQALSSMSSQISNDLTSNLTDIATGSVTAAQGFSNMTASILKDIEQMIIKITVVEPLMRTLQSTIGGSFGSLFGGGTTAAAALPLPGSGAFIGPVVAATGGYITGPGSATSDSISARLSNGEFVVNAAATSQHRALLEAMNSGSVGFANGGMVGTPTVQPVAQRSSAGSPVGFGDIIINVPEGTDPTNAAAIAAAVKPMIAQVTDERIRYHMRPRGMLSN